MNGRKWIAGAIEHPGAFSANAKRHHKSVAAFASQVLSSNSKASAHVKKQANLYKTLMKMNRK